MTRYAARISRDKYSEAGFAIVMAVLSCDGVTACERNPAYVSAFNVHKKGSVQLFNAKGLVSKPVKVNGRWQWPELDYSLLMERLATIN